MPISQKGPRGGLCDLKTAAKCVFWAENESQRGWRGERGPKPEVRGRNAVSGPRRAENGGMTTKSMKMGQNRGRSAHLREFAFICGPFWAFGGLRRAGKPVFYRKWTQIHANGDREGNFSRKTGNFQEDRRGTGLHRVFLLFPVFLLSQGERMAVGTRRVGRTRPTRWGKGKPILNVECGMSNGEVERARGGLKRPISTANGREWTRTRAQAGNFSRAGDRKYACSPAGSPRVRARGAPRLGADRKSTGGRFGGSDRSEPRPPNSSPLIPAAEP